MDWPCGAHFPLVAWSAPPNSVLATGSAFSASHLEITETLVVNDLDHRVLSKLRLLVGRLKAEPRSL